MDRDPPEAPANPEKYVGIDVGILTYAHDTDGTAVGSLDLSDDRERLEREQRKLSRKHTGRTAATLPPSRGGHFSWCSKTNANERGRTPWRSTREERPRSASCGVTMEKPL